MSELLTVSACFAQGGVEVRVGEFVELSPMPGDDFTRLVQVKALWSEPTQARHRLLACCQRFYRAPVGTITHPMHAVSHSWLLSCLLAGLSLCLLPEHQLFGGYEMHPVLCAGMMLA